MLLLVTKYEFWFFSRSDNIMNLTLIEANSSFPPNLTTNWTQDGTEALSRPFTIQQLLWGLNKFLTPVIILIGLVGNVTSFFVFVRTHVRRLSSSVYLAALAVADTGFLLQLFVTWLNYVRVFLFHKEVWCQTIVYLSYVCSFLSVWYVVGFTVERYIAVCYPLKRQDMCTSLRAKKVVLFLALFACVAYSFGIWTSGLVEGNGRMQCQPLPQYRSLVNIFNNIDTVITLIIPCVCIFVLNVRLATKIKYFYKKRMVMTASYLVPNRTKSEQRPSINPTAPGTDDEQNANTNLNGNSQAASLRPRAQISMTKMLLVVSTIFLILNLPSHVIRVHGWVMDFIDPSYRPPSIVITLQQFFTIIYYCNFSINFFLYSLCGKNFRSALFRMCKCQNNQFLPVRLPSRPTGSPSDNTMKSFVSQSNRTKNEQQETDAM